MLARSDLRDRAVQPSPPTADGSKSTCGVDFLPRRYKGVTDGSKSTCDVVFLPDARHGGMLSPSGARINAKMWQNRDAAVWIRAPRPGDLRA